MFLHSKRKGKRKREKRMESKAQKKCEVEWVHEFMLVKIFKSNKD